MENSNNKRLCRTIVLNESDDFLVELIEIFNNPVYRKIIIKDENIPKTLQDICKGKDKITICNFFKSLLIHFYNEPYMQKYIINNKKMKECLNEISEQFSKEISESKNV